MSNDQIQRKMRLLERELQRANAVVDTQQELIERLKASLQERTRQIKRKFDPDKMRRVAEREVLPVALDLIEMRSAPVSGDDIEQRVNSLRKQKGIPPKATGSVKRACRMLADLGSLIRVADNTYAVSSVIVGGLPDE